MWLCHTSHGKEHSCLITVLDHFFDLSGRKNLINGVKTFKPWIFNCKISFIQELKK